MDYFLIGRNGNGLSRIDDAGDVIFNDFPRVYQDAKASYGVTLVVDRSDGRRVRTSLYYNKGKLYLAEAIVLPARGDKDMTTPSRFDQPVRSPPHGRFDSSPFVRTGRE